MILPVFKLGTLAVKTLSKPVAQRLKQQAAIHPRFRQFIIDIAQANHRITTKMQRRNYSRAIDAEIRPLNEEKAVQSTADLIGGLFVFSVAGLLLIYEVQRSARSEARKEKRLRQQLLDLKQKSVVVEKEIDHLWQRFAELEQMNKDQGLSGIINFGQGNT